MTYKRLYGDKLKEFLKSAPLGKISKADRKVMEKKARRWAWEQVQALQARDTVVPPPGYAEMGKTEKVFPVQQMKAFAKEQLDELFLDLDSDHSGQIEYNELHKSAQ